MTTLPVFISLYFVAAFTIAFGRHIDNRTIHSNHTIDTGDSNCLHACLDECLEWRNATFTSEDCLIPCAVYVEEAERFMSDHGGPGPAAPHCNDTRGTIGDIDKGEKPGKAIIRMSRVTLTNVTEVWWTHVPAATAYRIQVWCRDQRNATLIFEEETWLSWYAFKQCHEKCPEGNHARVAALNSHGLGEFSEFTDKLVESTNATAALMGEDRHTLKLFGFTF